jgi:hypothetical protein
VGQPLQHCPHRRRHGDGPLVAHLGLPPLLLADPPGMALFIGCIPHIAGSFTTLSAEGGIRPDVYVGLDVAGPALSGPLAGLLPMQRAGRP